MLIEGELDNTKLGHVTGWMRFAGVAEKVTFDLKEHMAKFLAKVSRAMKAPAVLADREIEERNSVQD